MAGRNKWSYTTGKKYKERPIGTTHVKKAIQAWDKREGYIGLNLGQVPRCRREMVKKAKERAARRKK